MKGKTQDTEKLYKTYRALKMVIDGRAYLSDEGILIEVARHPGNRGGLREEETA